MRSLIISLVILGLPLAEIAGFVLVGREVGLAMTLLLVLIGAIAGVMLLRIQGFSVLRRMQEAARTGTEPDLDVVGGALTFIAAILLIVPGFVSDIIGLLLLLPPVRRALAAFLRTRTTILTTGTGFYYKGGHRSARPDERSEGRRSVVIDLDEDEFSRQGKNENNPPPPTNRISD